MKNLNQWKTLFMYFKFKTSLGVIKSSGLSFLKACSLPAIVNTKLNLTICVVVSTVDKPYQFKVNTIKVLVLGLSMKIIFIRFYKLKKCCIY